MKNGGKSGGEWSGRSDSNTRPPAPKAGALTRLRYAPTEFLAVQEGRIFTPSPVPMQPFSRTAGRGESAVQLQAQSERAAFTRTGQAAAELSARSGRMTRLGAKP